MDRSGRLVEHWEHQYGEGETWKSQTPTTSIRTADLKQQSEEGRKVPSEYEAWR